MIKKIKNLIGRFISWFNDPTRPLEKEYGRLLIEARNLQRKGDIPAFAKKTREAEDIRDRIDKIKEQK